MTIAADLFCVAQKTRMTAVYSDVLSRKDNADATILMITGGVVGTVRPFRPATVSELQKRTAKTKRELACIVKEV